MSRKPGLPKRLSFNGKARSTSKANKNQRQWETVTHERTFTNVMNGITQYVPRPMRKFVIRNGEDAEAFDHEGLLRNLKQIQKKIDKQTGLSHNPDDKIAAPARIKLLKLKKLHSRQMQTLQTANTYKQLKDQHDMNRLIRRKLVENQEMIRLEKGKLVPKKKDAPVWNEKEKEAFKKELLDEFGTEQFGE